MGIIKDLKNMQLMHRRALISSIIGSTVEWYDFFLFGILASIVLNTQFFPSENPTISLLLAYGTFAAGFVARPIGGLVSGHIGDLFGRRNVLIYTLGLMGIATTLIGLLPTYESIGITAPILLVSLRIIQGLALGGEWGGSVLITYEHSPKKKRGFFTSMVQIGLSIGILVASGSIALLDTILSNENFMAWGWRICFLISAFLVILGLWIRLKIDETPDFQQIQEKAETAKRKVPVVDMWQHSKREFLWGIGARIIDGVFFNIFAVFAVSYLINTLDYSRNSALLAVMLGACTLTICIPISGYISDKVNRTLFYTLGALASAISTFPAFYVFVTFPHNFVAITLAIVIPYGIIYSTVYGNVAALQCDLFSAKVRYTGISLVYQLTSSLAGFTALIATMLVSAANGAPWLVCLYTLACGILAGVSGLVLYRRGGRKLIENEQLVPRKTRSVVTGR